MKNRKSNCFGDVAEFPVKVGRITSLILDYWLFEAKKLESNLSDCILCSYLDSLANNSYPTNHYFLYTRPTFLKLVLAWQLLLSYFFYFQTRLDQTLQCRHFDYVKLQNLLHSVQLYPADTWYITTFIPFVTKSSRDFPSKCRHHRGKGTYTNRDIPDGGLVSERKMVENSIEKIFRYIACKLITGI